MTDMMALILSALLATAVWFDVRQRRIPNLLIVIGLAVGLLSGALQGGWAELGRHALGAVTGLAFLLPFFILRVLGAGDAKLMAVVGGFTGVFPLLFITLYTFIAGGILALVGVARAGGAIGILETLRNSFVTAALRLHGAPAPDQPGSGSAMRLPYAVAIAAGVAIWLMTRIQLP